MEKEQRRVVREQMVALMQSGHSWQEASTMVGVQISRSAAYRLLQKVRTQGEAGLQDGRHGRASQTARTRASLGSKTTATPLPVLPVISCSRPLPIAVGERFPAAEH